MFSVPMIDISAWDDGDETQRRAIASAVDDACRTIGFMQITGHGISQSVIDDMQRATASFFDLPLDVKKRTVPKSPDTDRGYAPMGTEALSYSLGVDAPPDLFEAFNTGPDEAPADPLHAEQVWFAPNNWPAEVPELRPALVTYFEAAATVAHRLTDIFAVALGLEPDFFVNRTDHSTDTMRVNNYVRQPGSPDPLPGQQRMGAHTDYGIVTVLYADRVPGLEIVGPDGEWHGVVPEEGALLVNLGDLISEWTNDLWRSTMHRVVPPPRHVDGPARRRSVAFFHDGNYDALVEVLPTCISEERPARYAPVLAGEHLMNKLLGPRTLSVSTSTIDTVGDRAGALG